jgi:hypothetical protein
MYPVSPIQPDLHSSQLVVVGRVGWQDTNLPSSWSSPSIRYGARSIRVPHTRARENVLIAGRQLLLKQLWRSLWKGGRLRLSRRQICRRFWAIGIEQVYRTLDSVVDCLPNHSGEGRYADAAGQEHRGLYPILVQFKVTGGTRTSTVVPKR